MLSRATTQVFIAIISIVLFVGYSANPPNGRTGAPGDGSCNDCHSGGASFDGSISISGLPADVMAGSSYPLTVTVTNPNGQAAKAGFQIVALNSNDTNAGTLSNPGANSTISSSAGRSYHEHNPSQNFPGSNMVSFTVDWTAPSGPNGDQITIYGAGNIANGNGNTSGDKIVYFNQSTNLIANTTPPIVDIQIINEISCNGASDGTVEAIGSDGTAPYNYSWSNGQSGNIASNLGPGTYTVTVTDDAGLTATDNITLSEPSILSASHVITNTVSCFGGNDGAAIINGSGGTLPYAFLWSDGTSTAINDSMNAGIYGFTITDANGCTFSSNLVMTEPAALLGDITIISIPSCPGSADATVSADASGGVPPYTFEWSNGSEGPIQIDLPAGTYTITTTDFNGCKDVSDFQIFNPDEISIILDTIIHLNCFGDNNGAISVSAAAGNGAPYSFEWSNGSNANHILDLAGGDYVVTVSDANLCTVSETFTVLEPDSLVTNASIINEVLCFADSTGVVNIITSGGTMPYAYIWSNGYTGGQMNDNLPAGTYSVTVIDSKNCEDSTTFIITEPDSLSLSMSATNESIAGANDGSATANLSGGTMPYFYLWSNDSTTQTITNLSAGNYSLTATDINGCTNIGSVIINAGDCELTTTQMITNASCYGGSDGSASVSLAGGLEPYNYNWDNGAMDSTITMLSAGTYGLTVVDAAMCSVALNITIDQPDSLEIFFNSLSTPICENDSTGIIQTTGNGGIEGYSYLWSTGDTTNQIENIPSGNYNLTLTDSNNCIAIDSFELNFMDTVPPTLNLLDLTLFLDENGTAGPIELDDFIESSSDNCGGPVSISFLSELYTCENIDSIIEISVIAEDENGNAIENFFALNVLDTISPTIICPENIVINTCSPFIYELPEVMDNCGIESLELISGIGSGNIFPAGETEEVYIVTDLSGNTSTCSFTVTSIIDMTISSEIFDESCTNACDGEAVVNIIGGTPPYTIEPTNLADLCPGNYSVTITDAAGCVIIDSFEIEAAPEFIISNIEIQNASGSGNDGSIDITVQGGTEPLTFEWLKDGLSFSMDEDINNLEPGMYACIITDNNDCIIVTDEIIITIESSIDNLISDGQIRIYPNPSSNILFIEYNFENQIPLNISIIGLDGKIWKEWISNSGKTEEIAVSTMPAGIYIIHINSLIGQSVKRVLISH